MRKNVETVENYDLEKWSEIVEGYTDSGLRVTEYCKKIGITPSRYYYYLKKAKRTGELTPKLVSVDLDEAYETCSKVSIRYYGASIEISADDEVSLCAVLSALKKS